jgi:plastocyanin
MSRLHTGCAALLALAFVAACGKDSTRTDVAGPGSSGSAGFSSNSGNGGGGNADDDGDDGDGNRTIAMRDDCDPRDPAWGTIGCARRRGDVTVAEFTAENNSALAASVVGHQAWRNDPNYLELRTGRTVRIRNEGGRPHTFTEVAMFGGGRVPDPNLNKGLVTAPECQGPNAPNIAPGGRTEVSGLTVGNHRFQCCNHPWMRAIIKVKAHGDHGDDD